VDSELIAQMKKRGTYYVSTFTVDESAFVLAIIGDARRSLSRRRALAGISATVPQS